MRDIIFAATLYIVGFILLILFCFSLSFVGYKTYEFFAPRYVAVDSKVFKESVQYNEGMVRDLSELERQMAARLRAVDVRLARVHLGEG